MQQLPETNNYQANQSLRRRWSPPGQPTSASPHRGMSSCAPHLLDGDKLRRKPLDVALPKPFDIGLVVARHALHLIVRMRVTQHVGPLQHAMRTCRGSSKAGQAHLCKLSTPPHSRVCSNLAHWAFDFDTAFLGHQNLRRATL